MSPIRVPAARDINHAFLAAVNVTRTITPSLLLTVSYGFNRWSEREAGATGDFPSINPITTLGLPGIHGRFRHPNHPRCVPG